MKFFSFENATQTTTENDEIYITEVNVLYDLFERKLAYNPTIIDNSFTVGEEDSGRIDLISRKLYSSMQYVEETLIMNNIVNPFSIEQNDTIYYTSDYNKLDLMHIKDKTINQDNKYKILNINKNKTSTNSVSLPPSVNPGIDQLSIDYNKKKITIINKFK